MCSRLRFARTRDRVDDRAARTAPRGAVRAGTASANRVMAASSSFIPPPGRAAAGQILHRTARLPISGPQERSRAGDGHAWLAVRNHVAVPQGWWSGLWMVRLLGRTDDSGNAEEFEASRDEIVDFVSNFASLYNCSVSAGYRAALLEAVEACAAAASPRAAPQLPEPQIVWHCRSSGDVAMGSLLAPAVSSWSRAEPAAAAAASSSSSAAAAPYESTPAFPNTLLLCYSEGPHMPPTMLVTPIEVSNEPVIRVRLVRSFVQHSQGSGGSGGGGGSGSGSGSEEGEPLQRAGSAASGGPSPYGLGRTDSTSSQRDARRVRGERRCGNITAAAKAAATAFHSVEVVPRKSGAGSPSLFANYAAVSPGLLLPESDLADSSGSSGMPPSVVAATEVFHLPRAWLVEAPQSNPLQDGYKHSETVLLDPRAEIRGGVQPPRETTEPASGGSSSSSGGSASRSTALVPWGQSIADQLGSLLVGGDGDEEEEEAAAAAAAGDGG